MFKSQFKLFTRVIYILNRIYLIYIHRIYLWLIVIPYLVYREKLDKTFAINFTFNSIAILEHKRVFKVALNRKSTIDMEFNNFERISDLFPGLANNYPDYKMKKNSFISYLLSTRYNSIDLTDSILAAVKLIKLIREYHIPGVRLKIIESAELVAGLNIISDIYGDTVNQMVQQIVDGYLKNGKYNIGLAHGDFHSSNIVIDEHHNPRIIDLDCVRFRGIQQLDVMYFLIEYEWAKTGKLWHETITRYLRNNISIEEITILKKFDLDYDHGLAVTFFVDRIGQESINYGIKYSNVDLASVINEILSMSLNITTELSQTRQII